METQGCLSNESFVVCFSHKSQTLSWTATPIQLGSLSLVYKYKIQGSVGHIKWNLGISSLDIFLHRAFFFFVKQKLQIFLTQNSGFLVRKPITFPPQGILPLSGWKEWKNNIICTFWTWETQNLPYSLHFSLAALS